MDIEKLYTTKEAAKILGLSEYTIRKKIRDGEIPAILGISTREGHRIRGEEIENYVNSHQRYGRGYLEDMEKQITRSRASKNFLFSDIAMTNILSGEIFNNKKNNEYEWINDDKIVNLRLEQLNDEIEALKYAIEIIELNNNQSSNINIDEKRKILECKAKIKILENNIKEIQIRRNLLYKNNDNSETNELNIQK